MNLRFPVAHVSNDLTEWRSALPPTESINKRDYPTKFDYALFARPVPACLRALSRQSM